MPYAPAGLYELPAAGYFAMPRYAYDFADDDDATYAMPLLFSLISLSIIRHAFRFSCYVTPPIIDAAAAADATLKLATITLRQAAPRFFRFCCDCRADFTRQRHYTMSWHYRHCGNDIVRVNTAVTAHATLCHMPTLSPYVTRSPLPPFFATLPWRLRCHAMLPP